MSHQRVLIYPVDYGSNAEGNGLSPMGTRTVHDAIRFINDSQLGAGCILGMCGANLPHLDMSAAEGLGWKSALFNAYLRNRATRIRVSAMNTIEETQLVKASLDKFELAPDRIEIFCEWWHSWRIRYVWKKTFPLSRLIIHTMPWIESNDYILPTMRSRWKWPLLNLVGLDIVILIGIERAKRLTSPAPRFKKN